jgi:hypothetical protein
LFRKDLSTGYGCDVAVNKSVEIQGHQLTVYELSDLAVLWVSFWPKELLRYLCLLLIAVVFCPRSYDTDAKKNFACYLVESSNKLLSKHPDTGIVLTGYISSLNALCFSRILKFVQVVEKSTSGSNILNKVFPSCSKLYCEPVVLCPCGKFRSQLSLIEAYCLCKHCCC